MAISTCTVSGTIRDSGGNAISGAIVTFNFTTSHENGADDFVVSAKVSTTTNGSGAFSLVVSRTANISRSGVWIIEYPDGTTNAGKKIVTLPASIPDASTATFNSTITTP